MSLSMLELEMQDWLLLKSTYTLGNKGEELIEGLMSEDVLVLLVLAILELILFNTGRMVDEPLAESSTWASSSGRFDPGVKQELLTFLSLLHDELGLLLITTGEHGKLLLEAASKTTLKLATTESLKAVGWGGGRKSNRTIYARYIIDCYRIVKIFINRCRDALI